MEGKLLVRTIIEMAGAPKEYIESTLKDYIKKLKKEGLDIVKEEYAPAKEEGKMFSVFVELEANFKDVADLFAFCFDSMPSSVEILEPAEMKFDSNELSNLLNDLQAKLHEVDMLVKSVRAQNKILDQNATNVFNNFIVFSASKEPKTTEQISDAVGVPPKQLQPFINKLVDGGRLKKEGDKYLKNE